LNDHSSEPSRPKEGSKDGEIDFRKIVEIANVGIVIAKPEGAYIFVNNKLAEMLGYSISEILGKSATDFANGEDSKEKVLQARRDVRKNKFASGELKFRRKDGSVLWAHYNSSAISNSNGKHIANVAMLTDITERKHAEEEILSLSRFPSENPNAVYRINKEGLVLYANPASKNFPDR
jgi:PAS domain S-box-containing protein